MIRPKIGVQLYNFRDYTKTEKDLDETLAKLEVMGVEHIQVSAIGPIPAEKQRDIYQKHNMKVCVTHKPLDRILDDTENLIEEHKIIGCDAIGLGYVPVEFRDTVEKSREFIEKLSVAAKKIKENGMTFNYHNHDFEFKKLHDSDLTFFDLLVDETNSDEFHFIPDIGWIHFTKTNPVDVLKRINGRVKVLHFKDYTYHENGDMNYQCLGEGLTNLKECYEASCELDIPYLLYEHDEGWENNDPFAACEKSFKYMQKLDASYKK